MPVRITEDIWREIVDCVFLANAGRYGIPLLKVLASVDRLLRDITVPLLFRSLRFTNRTRTIPASRSEVTVPALTHLIRDYKRVCSLRAAPYLLQHVRELTLDNWSRGDTGSFGESIDGMVLVVYDLLIGLAERTPRLRYINVSTSRIGPRLVHLLLSSPQIEWVSLSFLEMDTVVDIRPDLQISCRIRHLHYQHRITSNINMYLPIIFEHCGKDLQSLHLGSAALAMITPLASRHALRLTSLAVDFDNNHTTIIRDIWNFLPHCPELRALSLPLVTEDLPPNLPQDVIPHLEFLSVQRQLLPIFTAGRNLNTINIIGRPGAYPVRGIVGCRTVLQRLSLSLRIDTYGELPKFIRSINIFTTLVFLRLGYIKNLREFFSGVISHKMSLEVPSSLLTHCSHLIVFKDSAIFINALRPLETLRVCDVRGNARSGHSTEIICPMGSCGNPDDRRHPSLETIWLGCADHRWWVWSHSEGWQRMPESYNSPYGVYSGEALFGGFHPPLR